MTIEKCKLCGAFVKEENLKRHYDRVHPTGAGLLPRTQVAVGSGSVFKKHRARNVLVLTLVVLAVIGVSAAANQFAATSTVRMHIHPRVSAMINGSPMTIPAQIGIASNLWVDHSLDQYGIGMAPLHIHDATGEVHEESNTVRDFTLHQFLAIWGKSIDAGQVLGHPVDPGHRAYLVVNGVQEPASADPVFVNGQLIQMTCGP